MHVHDVSSSVYCKRVSLDRCRQYSGRPGTRGGAARSKLPAVAINRRARDVSAGGTHAAKKKRTIKIGVVLSGGQAPGGHNVIVGLYDFVNAHGDNDSAVYGFRNGPKGVFTGDYVQLTDKLVDRFRNMGGFDMIGSGQSNI